jgi:hypothetical protein
MKKIIIALALSTPALAQVVPPSDCKEEQKQGPIYQCCPRTITKVIEKKVPEIKIVKETKIVEKPVIVTKEVVVTKEVPAKFPKYNISAIGGFGDNGFKTVIYNKTDYEFKKDYGLIIGIQGQRFFDNNFSLGVGALSNDSYFGSIGYSFGER